MPPIRSALDTKSPQYVQTRQYYGGLVDTLRGRISQAVDGGRDKSIERHRGRGKLLPRERIDLIIDDHSAFLEFSSLAMYGQYDNEIPAAGIVTGIGMVHGIACVIIANDGTVKGGSFFPITVKKHLRAQEIAEMHRLPCIYMVDCGGAYLPVQDEVMPDRHHFGNTFYRQTRMSADGLPQISAVFGGATAGGAYIPSLSDQVVMVKGTSQLFLGGPAIVKAAISEIVDANTLGGAEMHTFTSGVSDHIAETEQEALCKLREIVGSYNWYNRSFAPPVSPKPPLYDPEEINGLIAEDTKIPYDSREVIARMVDGSEFAEFKPDWGATLVCGFAHIHGFPIGILANNGTLFSESALKGAHFIELCNQRNIPLLFLHNIAGFMVGSEAEAQGIAKNSAKMVYAVANARVPRYSVVMGGSYGAGNYGMCGRGFVPNFMFTWPTAQVGTMAAETAITIMTDIRQGSIRRGEPTEEELQEIRDEVQAQYDEQLDPYYGTSRLWDDGIIEPAQTRDVMGLCLSLAHGLPAKTGHSPVYRM